MGTPKIEEGKIYKISNEEFEVIAKCLEVREPQYLNSQKEFKFKILDVKLNIPYLQKYLENLERKLHDDLNIYRDILFLEVKLTPRILTEFELWEEDLEKYQIKEYQNY